MFLSSTEKSRFSDCKARPGQNSLFALVICLAFISHPTLAQSTDGSEGLKAVQPPGNIVMAPELIPDLRVSGVKVRDLGALNQAQVVVENVSGVRYTLEYQFNWTDDEGFIAGTSRTWHRFVLAPGEQESFTSTAQVTDATNAEFSLRLPDDYFLNHDERQQPPWRDEEPQTTLPQIENRGEFPDDLPGR